MSERGDGRLESSRRMGPRKSRSVASTGGGWSEARVQSEEIALAALEESLSQLWTVGADSGRLRIARGRRPAVVAGCADPRVC